MMISRALLATALAAGAIGSMTATAHAQAVGQDRVTGSGAASPDFDTFDFSATSDPSGADPSGSASWNNFYGSPFFHFQGSVVCLQVDGNQADMVVRVDQAASTLSFESFTFHLVDGGPAGSGQDRIDWTFGALPTTCAQLPVTTNSSTVVSGDIAIEDAPELPTAKDQCKNGGWRDFGVFKNQGQCVSFVATGGKQRPGTVG
jgi:hypothetical protein